MEIVTLVAAFALVWKFVDWAKFVLAKDLNASLTQVVAWGAGVAVAFLIGASDFGDDWAIGSRTFGSMNAASLILIGLIYASAGSAAFDLKKAIDNTDSAKTPPLVG